MAAFGQAVSQGYHFLETDVHTTSDGELLAFHDTVLDRVTDRQGAICELELEEVRRARVGGLEQIPTLAELFEAFPDVCFNIDLKSEGAVVPLIELIHAHGAWDRVLVGSFSHRRLSRFRSLTCGRVPTSASMLEAVAFFAVPSGRMADFLTRGRVSALQIPRRRGPLLVASRWFVRRMHAAGKHVHVWTIDDAEEMRELLDLGVDGLMTDRTDRLKTVLLERGQWRGTP